MTGIPGGYTAIARDPAKTIEVGGDAITFASVCGPSFVSDLDKGRRAGTYDEMCDFIRLVQRLNMSCILTAAPGSNRWICRLSPVTWT